MFHVPSFAFPFDRLWIIALISSMFFPNSIIHSFNLKILLVFPSTFSSISFLVSLRFFPGFCHSDTNLLGIQTFKHKEMPNKQFPRNRASSDLIYFMYIQGKFPAIVNKSIRNKKKNENPQHIKDGRSSSPPRSKCQNSQYTSLAHSNPLINPITLWSLPNLFNKILGPTQQPQFPSTFPVLPLLRYVCIIGGLTSCLA